MATLQARTSRGHRYWSIVESRRVNGKPRPVILEYLGKPEALLRRLQGGAELTVKSYAHGAVAALLGLVARFQLPQLINQYVQAQRPYMAPQPRRNGLTAGITLVLAALGRVCQPTSKRAWYTWAQTTSCQYLLRVNLAQVDSQHFWDLMDCLPVRAIPEIELEVARRITSACGVPAETLLFDTTNFYTYIDSTNTRCTLARRGANKQKRYDLRQIGLALVVTRDDFLPLFHHTYQGNHNDQQVFAGTVRHLRRRLLDLGLSLDHHTLVFDRGNNSQANLHRVHRLKLHYVGALTPSQHPDLMSAAEGHFVDLPLGDTTIPVYREQRVVWGQSRTVVVLVSARLKAGQLRGIYQALAKRQQQLRALQRTLAQPRARKRTRAQLAARLDRLLHGQFLAGLIRWRLHPTRAGRFRLTWRTDRRQLRQLEDHLGLRLLMTDRHEWSTAEIIRTYHGQAAIEAAFKNLKNPYHLAIHPGFHWTDQKLEVHHFTCVLGYQLAALLWRQARTTAHFTGTLDHLLDTLSRIRLAVLLEAGRHPGRAKSRYQLEEMTPAERRLLDALELGQCHLQRPAIAGISVYDK